jgi:hypothetical protein
MTAIDWAYLGANFLWIFGLSLILATVSYHTWLTQETGQPFATQVRSRGWRVAVAIGLSLVPLSITLMPRSERWFVRLIALVVSMALAAFALRTAWRAGNANRGTP